MRGVLALLLSAWCVVAWPVPIENYGGVADNATDNTPALAAAMAAGVTRLEFGVGNYRFTTKPPSLHGIKLIGAGAGWSGLVRAYQPTSYYDSFLDFVGNVSNGSGVEGFSVTANDSTGGVMVRFRSTLGSPQSYSKMSDVVITYAGAANYNLAIYVDGNEANTAAQGVRALTISNVIAFQPTGIPWVADIRNCVNCLITNFWSNGSMYVGGGNGSDPARRTTSLNAVNFMLGGTLYIDYAVGIVVNGQAFTVVFTPLSLYSKFFGHAPNESNSCGTCAIYK